MTTPGRLDTVLSPSFPNSRIFGGKVIIIFRKNKHVFSTPGGGRFSRAPPFVKSLRIHVHQSPPIPPSFVPNLRDRPNLWRLCSFSERVHSEALRGGDSSSQGQLNTRDTQPRSAYPCKRPLAPTWSS